jgi:hypothetical protein
MPTSADLFLPELGRRSRGTLWSKRFPRLDARRCPLPLVIIFAFLALAPQPVAAQEVPDEYPECISHLWAAGSQLGRAEAIAGHDAPSEDARMFESVHGAGEHVERAHELCPKHPAPWPAWSNWLETQNQLAEMADKFRDSRMDRAQLAIALAGMHQSLAAQLAFRVLPTHLERDATCVEIYERLGEALGFAQTTTQIFHRLMPDAVLRLRKALSLIYQMREMPQPCRNFKGLIPAIGEALNSPIDPSVVGRVDDIWHAGEVAAALKAE